MKFPFTKSGQPATQLNTILTLTIVLRLTIALFYTQQGLFNAYTDFHTYYRVALYSQQGYYPFINMWYEYPPLLAYLPQAVFWLVEQILPMGDANSLSFLLFSRILSMVVLIFDVGVLVLLHRITQQVWGTERADWVGWVYASLSLPIFFMTFAHQIVPVFFLMLAIYFLITSRNNGSAIALGLGIASKITPIFFLAPAIRFLLPQKKTIINYGMLTLASAALIYLPFVFLGGGKWVIASFRALSEVGSYGTVWAILDGNWGPGTYGDLATRLELAMANVTQSNPGVFPGWLGLLVFTILYAAFYIRPLREVDGKHLIWFTTLTALVFHLWLKGWSPHWAMTLLPLFLLSSPDRAGLRWTLLLTALVFLEWPFSILFGNQFLTALGILLRTALFIGIALDLIGRLWPGWIQVKES